MVAHLGKPDEGLQLNIKLKSQITQEATKKAGILDALLKGASHGYGENGNQGLLIRSLMIITNLNRIAVKKWDGGVSKLNGKGGSNGHHNAANIDDDDYNEEFDRGKVSVVVGGGGGGEVFNRRHCSLLCICR